MWLSLTFDHKISGVPCQIEVSCSGQEPFKGPAHLCDSDHDFYGHLDIEYVILDRKGYVADWLCRKLTQDAIAGIEEEARRLILN